MDLIVNQLLDPNYLYGIKAASLDIRGVPLYQSMFDESRLVASYDIVSPETQLKFYKAEGSLLDSYCLDIIVIFNQSMLASYKHHYTSNWVSGFNKFADYYPYMFTANLLVKDGSAIEKYDLGKIQPLKVTTSVKPDTTHTEVGLNFCITGPINLLEQVVYNTDPVPVKPVVKQSPPDRFEDLDI